MVPLQRVMKVNRPGRIAGSRYWCQARLWVGLLGMLLCQPASPHGSVVDEDDLCLISVGFYRAHFTIYQPRTAGHDEYCEDLPGTGETVFVMDYLHDSMRDVPVDFRIVRDRNGVGRFARYEDVLDLDLDQDTVFYRPAEVRQDAVYTVLHDFGERGDFIGVVSVAHPSNGEVYRAVFPFRVGALPMDYIIWGGGLVLALSGVMWGWTQGRKALRESPI